MTECVSATPAIKHDFQMRLRLLSSLEDIETLAFRARNTSTPPRCSVDNNAKKTKHDTIQETG